MNTKYNCDTPLLTGDTSGVAKKSHDQANNFLNQVIYAISHDLSTPVRHLESYAAWLIEDNEEVSDNVKQQLGKIIRASQRLKGMISELTLFFNSQKQLPQKCWVELNPIVEKIRETTINDTPSRLINWTISHLPSVFADKTMLTRLFERLLSNAVKFTRIREVAEIHIAVEEHETEFIFSIVDNGDGFDMKQEQKLFHIFQRIHSQSEFEGYGMGLADAQQIVEVHGGRIWGEGEVDKGASFYFALPKAGD